MKVVAVVPAAGVGLRLKSAKPKPLVLINNKPILIHVLSRINSHPKISSIIVAVHRKYLDSVSKVISRYRLKKVKAIVKGGITRSKSVRNCLKQLPADTDIVMIHDGVRPFVTQRIIDKAIETAGNFGSAVVGVPLKPTIKMSDDRLIVRKTIDRKNIWEIQTPQVFKKGLILNAYKRFKNLDATDDASLVENLGVKVRIVPGSYFNIKITTFEDLVIAKAIAKYKAHK